MLRCPAFALGIALSSFVLAAPPTSTEPVEGLRDNTPQRHVLAGARIVVEPGRIIERGYLVVRDGVIVAVGAGEAPADAGRVWPCAGRTIYPGLIDGYSEADADTKARPPAAHWSGDVRPDRSLAGIIEPDSATNAKLRSQGVTCRLVVPKAGVIKGTSVLVTTGDEPAARATVKPDVALHVRLTVLERRQDRFPGSPMGAVALARQAWYDALWHRDALRAARGDATLPRPERNDALDALQPYLDGRGLVIADASNDTFVLRADRFAREFAIQLAIRGSGHEYARLDAVRATGRTLLLPVNFPGPPHVGTAETALNASLEDLLHWDLAPENPARLDGAGVKFAITTHGLDDAKAFLGAVRKAVARGLSPEAALRALTTTPAELFGVRDQVGSLAIGQRANFLVSDGELFASDTRVLETWINGRRYEQVETPSIDVRGNWRLAAPAWELELSGKSPDLAGVLRDPAAKPEAVSAKLTHVGFRDGRFSATFDGEKFGRAGIARLTAVAATESVGGVRLHGQIVWPSGEEQVFTAAAFPEKAEPKSEPKKTESPKPTVASFAVNYPLGAFGRESLPPQPTAVLLKGGRVWTCGPQGTLDRADVLLGNGRILQVAADIAAPEGALVVDVTGRHVTPGIIDCHSHMASDGGINEPTQAVTAEVRIGDFIDANDISIYRQLAGGVTASNILHGSANPIGGQCQVIKLRWGSLPEELKFAEAPAGIKFALGENVKQSNWGDRFSQRYPQSRMGVDQIIRDAFQSAREYQRRRERWEATRSGLPPRRDLELDALVEVLEGRRWVHCHSYRQDEILAFLQTAKEFGVRIGTLQHVLEGYKVADAIARHGATGSTFSDWWAYKFEVYDAIPFNGALMQRGGVLTSFNSDDPEMARRLNQEAGKATKYGGVPAEEALRFVTLNPARQLRIDAHVGSLEPGKHADVVVWSGPPLSPQSRCEQTWVDGRRLFDRAEDAQLRAEMRHKKNVLVQKVLASGEAMRKPDDVRVAESQQWPRCDEFCHGHGH